MTRRIVGWFVLVPLCAVLIVFALANRQPVLLHFNPFASGDNVVDATGVPMFVVLFVALLIGVVLGGVATWFAQGPHRREGRHFRRETERLHRELQTARRDAPATDRADDARELARLS